MKGISQQNNQNILKYFLVFSIFAHSVVLVFKSPGISFTSVFDKPKEKVIKIKLFNKNSKTKRQIVQTEKMIENHKKPMENAYLGKANNRVDRQTKAAITGKFKSAGIGNKKGTVQKTQSRKSAKVKEKVKNLKFSDLAVKSSPATFTKKKMQDSNMQLAKGLKNGSQKSMGLGQTNDYIEDVPLGDFTKLNTQQFEFYGFYDRIRQRLEMFWGTNIQEQAEKLMKKGRSIASDQNHITALLIELNEKGEIVDVSVDSPSGVRELDNAAIRTFNQAGPFPNPPKGMIKNGRAKIKWSFVVNS
jgi:TonB family protein